MTYNFKINNSGSSGRPEISLMGQHVAQIKLSPQTALKLGQTDLQGPHYGRKRERVLI